MDLPEGIYISNFVNATNENRKYQIVVENNYNMAHTLPRDSPLGGLEFSCQLIGLVSKNQELVSMK